MTILGNVTTTSTVLANRMLLGTVRSLVLSVVVTGCAAAGEITTRDHGSGRKAATLPQACPVNVMEPIVELGAIQGNTGVRVPEIVAAVQEAILAVARERCPDSQPTGSRTARPLLIATIAQWKQMRSDDPIGAFILPHNSIVIRLQLTNREAPESTRTVTFMNHARLTLNQPATHLLNSGFRDAVRALLSSDAP